MNERVVVAQASSLQVASLTQSRAVKITKPQDDQSVVVDLNHDYSAKLDLSAVVNEKVTLVQVDTKLVMLFDNQSTVTADPFFDSAGKPLADVNVELGTGHGVNGEQFAQLFSITDDFSALPDYLLPPSLPPSGADFQITSVDSMPDTAPPLTLFRPQVASGGHVDTGGVHEPPHQNFAALASTVVGSSPIVNIPGPGGAGTQVFEAGLGARGAEPEGSHPGSPSFPTSTRPGTINFGFGRATIGGGLGHARICQDSLRNRVIDRKSLGPRLVRCHGQHRKSRK